MKRTEKTYEATEVTYTFTEADVIAALCKVHKIALPFSQSIAESYSCGSETDGGFYIRLRWERLSEPQCSSTESVK